MFILTVAPIARGIPHGNLTYFAKENPPLGSLIMIPVRTREVPALVLAVSEASESKSLLKNSEYVIRKIARIKPRNAWSQEFLRAVQTTADYSAQDFGETLLALTPATILEQFIAGTQTGQHGGIPQDTTHKTSILAAQGTTKVRMDMYQRLVREAFAHRQSIFICLPQELDVERVTRELSRGIEDYTLTFSSSMTKKKILVNWERVGEEKHPILVIGTPQYLCAPRLFDTIIIDEEHSRSWKTLMRPTVDLRVFTEAYAQEIHATVVIGAPILRPETQRRIADGEVRPFERLATHAHRELLEHHLHTEIINPKVEEKALREQTGQRTFRIISNAVRDLILAADQKKESVLLITARKGLSPIIRCGDCGTIVCCPECETPLVLHGQKNDARIFSCHACGYIRAQTQNSFEKCNACDGWKLESMGIGTERIIEEIESVLPGKPILLFDGDVIKTATQAKKRIAQFTKDAE